MRTSQVKFQLNLLDLIKCDYIRQGIYIIIQAAPATGILYITEHSPYFLSGHIRLKGKDQGRYPYKYLEMIDNVFGSEPNTIEVCSRTVGDCFSVDIDPLTNPSLIDDAQYLVKLTKNTSFNRWRADPPYNENTAVQMYGSILPDTSKLLKAGARVCKPGSLLFLLLGPQNYQWCPKGVMRVGWICLTIVPNNELRALHIFYKYE
jgi:hypothetical protein